jgi:host factor-I protein
MRDNQKLQNEFLNQLRKTATPVSVFLKTGERLDGQIKSFDIYSLSLNCPEPRLVVKSVIATVQPAPKHAKKTSRKRMPSAAQSEPEPSVPVSRPPRKTPEVVTKRRRITLTKP